MSSNNPSISDRIRFSDAEKRILSAFENDGDVYDFIQWFTIGADLTVEEYEDELKDLKEEYDRLLSDLSDKDSELNEADAEMITLEKEIYILEKRVEELETELKSNAEQED